MRRTPSPLTPLMYTAISGAGIVLALAGGTNVALLVVGLAVAAIAGTLAVIAWAQGRSVSSSDLPVSPPVDNRRCRPDTRDRRAVELGLDLGHTLLGSSRPTCIERSADVLLCSG